MNGAHSNAPAPPTTDLDVSNKYLVGVQGGDLTLIYPPRRLSPNDAIVLAAWLVSLAEHRATVKFDAALEKVQST